MVHYVWTILWIYLFVNIIGIRGRYEDTWNGAYDEEYEDKKHDAEILKAVQDSVREWEANKNNKSRHKRAECNVCYSELGCFESSGPFTYLDTLPSSPDEISTTFLLYPGRRYARSITLGDNPLVEVPFNNITDAFDWATKHFNSSKPTKVLVHGFGSSCHYEWVYEIRSAFMSMDDVNIVCVDWENGAVLPNYVKAAANSRLVGKQLAMLLRGLEEKVGIPRNNMHLIGFSLGAHVAGFAGAELQNISRITGLDPAGPLFEAQHPDARLDPTDATFVDVIHSNGENLFLGGLGSWLPLGHVDFYPNGGRMQKGCSNIFVGAVSDFIWSSEVEGRSLCNHRRAYKFFVDSISPKCLFPAFPCDSYESFLQGNCFSCTSKRKCGNMGYFADKSIGRGQLFLITRDEEPFCAHQYNVKIESSILPKPLVNYGKILITLVGDSELNETFTMTSNDDEQLLPGQTLSRILVPHPIIAEPTKVQILYQGYYGWLSSGLKRWKIDKVSMLDSFGKMSSVCKKGLELESGIPVTLKLYPGDCNIPKDTLIQETSNESSPTQQNNITNTTNVITSLVKAETNQKFIPTPVILIGNEAIKDLSKPEKLEQSFGSNKVEDSSEVEQTRAFNTKKITSPEPGEVVLQEIVEPILKKPTNKNARSHDLSKPEISEPILGPTTPKSSTTSSNKKLPTSSAFISQILHDDDKYNDWVPQNDLRQRRQDGKNLKRHDSSTSLDRDYERISENTNPIRLLMMTVQFLPQRLSTMFQQAEKYARNNILPLISQHTPKFITNFNNREEKHEPKYLPLGFVESKSETKSPSDSKKVLKTDFNPPDVAVQLAKTDNHSLEELLKETTTDFTKTNPSETQRRSDQVVGANLDKNTESVTGLLKPLVPTEKVMVIYPEKKIQSITTNVESTQSNENGTPKIESNSRIYIDLPVFDERDVGIKYIPLIYPDTHKGEEKITR